MPFDEDLRRRFEALTDRIRDEVTRQLSDANDELMSSVEARAATAAAQAAVEASAAAERNFVTRLAAAEEDLADRLAAAKEDFATRLAAVEQDSAARVAAVEQDSAARIAAAEQNSAARVAAVEQDSAARVAALEGDFVARFSALEKDFTARVAAAEEEFAARVTAAEQDFAARVAAIERESAARVAAVEQESAARLAAVEQESAARAAASERDSTDRVAAVEQDFAARLSTVEQESAARLAAVEKDSAARLAEVEQDSAARIAAAEQNVAARVAAAEEDSSAGLAAAVAAAEARGRVTGQESGHRDGLVQGHQHGHGEARAAARATELAAGEHLVDAFRAIDRARSLSEVLDTLASWAGREAARVSVLLVSAGGLRGWRFIGFDAALDDASTFELPLEDAGIIGKAVRTGETAAADSGQDAPSFAKVPPGGAMFVVPIALNGQVVAVLFADQAASAAARDGSAEPRAVWRSILEVLARHATRSLEAMTAYRAAQIVTQRVDGSMPAAAPTIASEGDAGEPDVGTNDAHKVDEDEAARRYARLLISEIKLYHEPEVVAGRRDRDVATRLGGEIARARVLYEQRVPTHVRNANDHFHAELVRTLANGDPSLLGQTT